MLIPAGEIVVIARRAEMDVNKGRHLTIRHSQDHGRRRQRGRGRRPAYHRHLCPVTGEWAIAVFTVGVPAAIRLARENGQLGVRAVVHRGEQHTVGEGCAGRDLCSVALALGHLHDTDLRAEVVAWGIASHR
jgi:hypothetical protein